MGVGLVTPLAEVRMVGDAARTFLAWASPACPAAVWSGILLDAYSVAIIGDGGLAEDIMHILDYLTKRE